MQSRSSYLKQLMADMVCIIVLTRACQHPHRANQTPETTNTILQYGGPGGPGGAPGGPPDGPPDGPAGPGARPPRAPPTRRQAAPRVAPALTVPVSKRLRPDEGV